MNDCLFGDNAALAEQRSLLERLRSPTSYPHSVGEIKVIETHISFVILTGEFAYKIKKAVDLGFLDYTTLERRHFFCLEELRLNPRLAPDIYLGVVGIHAAGDDELRIDAEGMSSADAIEYAVKMRQFPQEALLDHLAATQGFTSHHLDQLAQTIARFHSDAAIAPPEAKWGSPDAVQALANANFELIRQELNASNLGVAFPTKLENWSLAELTRLQEHFLTRMRDGLIRECHGDLHLGNMVVINDRVEVFDGIEFEPALRWNDIQSEIAFFVMDMEERGHKVEAFSFLNSYLEICGDYSGLRAFNFYRVYRAMVRAKIALMRAINLGISTSSGQSALAAFNAYIDYAHGVATTRRGTLLLMHGFSGSGKTAVSQSLLERLGAIRIRSDVERKRIAALSAQQLVRERINEGLYGEQQTHLTYRYLQRLCADLLAEGFVVIVDAAFLKRQQRSKFAEEATAQGAPCFMIDCQAPSSVMAGRVDRRAMTHADASDATRKVLAMQQATSEPIEPDECLTLLEVDTTSDTPDAVTSYVIKTLEGALRNNT